MALEVFKSLNNFNPAFMQDYFLLKTLVYDLRIKNQLSIPIVTLGSIRTTNHGVRSQSFQEPKVWNSLPDSFKKAKNIKEFKVLTKTWFHENKCA